MRFRTLGAFLVILALWGCGGGIGGTYAATAEPYGEATRSDPGYTLAEVQKRLAESPRKLHLEGPEFRTSEAGKTIWEGTWRREGDRLILRAHRVSGTDVNEKLQQDYELKALQDGRFADEAVYRLYGMRIVFKKE